VHFLFHLLRSSIKTSVWFFSPDRYLFAEFFTDCELFSCFTECVQLYSLMTLAELPCNHYMEYFVRQPLISLLGDLLLKS
jgi:hypothetical protein